MIRIAAVVAVVAIVAVAVVRVWRDERPAARQTGPDAPVLSVSGGTISWDPISGVDQYVLASRVEGSETTYRVVEGDSVTPPAVPGRTVSYGLRANIDGSAWAREVSITYPERPEEPFVTGLVASADAVASSRWADSGLFPEIARIEFDISTPARELRPAIEAHAANGTRVVLLASFHRRLPTSAEARNLGSWARDFGPGGAFWAGRADASLAVRQIEFGNETSFGYQYGDAPGDAGYTARAREYALRLVDAADAVRAANPAVGLLAQADSGGTESSAWVDGMFEAVPDLAQRVAGWTVHPYGPRASWQDRMDRLIAQTEARGADDDVPIWITEWGISSDDGRCLDGNYGWDRCMTYAAAADALAQTVEEMRRAYGDRLRAFLLYQGTDQRPSGTSSSREHYFGALRSDRSAKGRYTDAVRELLAGAP
jgi:hypothetical protein